MQPTRVLYSFPHRIGAGRICTTAWHQVVTASEAGAAVEVHTASVHRPLPSPVAARETLARGRLRLPYRLVGDLRMYRLHDQLVARRLRKAADRFDVVHTWPAGALETLRAALDLGIPTMLERPNTHTRFAYEVVARECRRLGIELPARYEHAFNAELLAREEQEYRLADFILCPSDFVRETFLEEGFPQERLLRHIYGYDPQTFYPAAGRPADSRFGMLFVGDGSVRKGLHFALEAWLESPAHKFGAFQIAGDMLPAYKSLLEPMLEHPSVTLLGHSSRVPELMRQADVLVLPSIEEGSALVCAEALASGAVPLVSNVASSHCRHMENALVHQVGDVRVLSEHITRLFEDRALLQRLRDEALASAHEATWGRAGQVLAGIYRDVHERAARGDQPMAAV
ncbi:MAG: glycosyltransferase family 4 protein [Gaiellaceae bacterium]